MMSTATTDEAQALSPREVAKLLNVHVRTVQRAAARGEIPAVSIGRLIRIPRAVVEGMLRGETPRPQMSAGARR